MIRVVHHGPWIPMLTFYPSRIPDPGVKKALDPGSRSTTLNFWNFYNSLQIGRKKFSLLQFKTNQIFNFVTPWIQKR
jgi:hypothetical protein